MLDLRTQAGSAGVPEARMPSRAGERAVTFYLWWELRFWAGGARRVPEAYPLAYTGHRYDLIPSWWLAL